MENSCQMYPDTGICREILTVPTGRCPAHALHRQSLQSKSFYYSFSCEWEWTVEKTHWCSNTPCMSISVRWEMCLYGSHTSLYKRNSGVSWNSRIVCGNVAEENFKKLNEAVPSDSGGETPCFSNYRTPFLMACQAFDRFSATVFFTQNRSLCIQNRSLHFDP